MRKTLVLLLVVGLLLGLCGCGSNSEAASTVAQEPGADISAAEHLEASEPESAAKPVVDESLPLYFELDGGILAYKSYEFVSEGFYAYSDGDPAKTLVLNFDYTNTENEPKDYMSDFWICAYQNGVELNGPSSYRPDAAPESVQNAYNSVLKDGTLTIGIAFVLQDYSPITIIANHNGGTEVSDPMVLEIEPYESNAFDLNRLYGRWTDEYSGNMLTLTSTQIAFGDDKSNAWLDDPELWTDETTLHTHFTKIGDDLTIVEEDGQLRMYNDTVSLIQTENWPEDDPSAASEAAGSEPEDVAFGSPISVDFAEITFNDGGIQDSIEMSHTNGNGGDGVGGNITVRQIIESPQDGTQYIYLQGTVKNLDTSAIEPKNMAAKLVINDDYELECKISLVGANASSISRLEPLNEATIIIDASISDDMVSMIETATWLFGFEQSFTRISGSKDIADCQYYYRMVP